MEGINGDDPNLLAKKVFFDDLTPVHPDSRIVMETVADRNLHRRVVDMIVPIGFGRRGLIVSPPRAGKTILLQKMAKSVSQTIPKLRHHAPDRRAAGQVDRHGTASEGPTLRGDGLHLR